MTRCLNCEAEMNPGVVEMGDPVLCGNCGAEHEVICEVPLELALADDDDLDEPGGAADDDEEAGDEDEE
jgi:hypothetical protein